MFWMCLSAMNKVFIETSVHLKKIQSKNSQLSLCLSLHHTHFDYLVTPLMGSGSGFWFDRYSNRYNFVLPATKYFSLNLVPVC